MPATDKPIDDKPANICPWWLGILPWVVYGLGNLWHPVLSAPLAFGVMLVVAWSLQLRSNPLDMGIMGYFFILSFLSLTGLDAVFPARWLFALCPAVLAVASALSIVFRQPFTWLYARDYVGAQIRERPAFFLANQIISFIWTVGFVLAAVLISAPGDGWTPWRATVILLMVLGPTAASSVCIGLWFHLRDARALT